MTNNIQCPSCTMMFSDDIRLERHVKKIRQPKRLTKSNPHAEKSAIQDYNEDSDASKEELSKTIKLPRVYV